MLRASGRKTAVFSAVFSSMDARSKGSNRGFRTTLHAANERAGPFAFGLWSSVLSEYEVLFLVAGFRWPNAFRHDDDRAAGASVRNAPLELGGLILAQQISPLTQKTPIGETGRCLSSYRGSLQFGGAAQMRQRSR